MLHFVTDKERCVAKVNDSKYKVLVETLKNQILDSKKECLLPFRLVAHGSTARPKGKSRNR